MLTFTFKQMTQLDASRLVGAMSAGTNLDKLGARLVGIAKEMANPAPTTTLEGLNQRLSQVLLVNTNLLRAMVALDGEFVASAWMGARECQIEALYLPATQELRVSFTSCDPGFVIEVLGGVLLKFPWAGRRLSHPYEGHTPEERQKMDALKRTIEAGSTRAGRAKHELATLMEAHPEFTLANRIIRAARIFKPSSIAA